MTRETGRLDVRSAIRKRTTLCGHLLHSCVCCVVPKPCKQLLMRGNAFQILMRAHLSLVCRKPLGAHYNLVAALEKSM